MSPTSYINPGSKDGPKLTSLGKMVVFLFILGCGYGAYRLFQKDPIAPQNDPVKVGDPATTNDPSGPVVEIGIAYGTEKQRWLQWAAQQFAGAPEGAGIKVNLIPMGSLEGAQAVLAGDKRIHVWSPASSLYEDVFVQEWTIKHNGAPIHRRVQLALSPMVFVMWEERHAAFVTKFSGVTFETIRQAVEESSGWAGIAAKPDWGLFKFSHTHPNQSNSGLMTLVLMAMEKLGKQSGLSMADILDPGFQSWMTSIENGVSNMSNSTGNMMRDMVLRGPSTFDALFVYENVVIDYLKNAEGRWGGLRVVYPTINMWNDNPYYVIDAPWSGDAEKAAAGRFADFLMSTPIQAESLKHGFRPGNPDVAIKTPESPFVLYAKAGLKIDVDRVGDYPKAEVINNLLQLWQRIRGSR
jgi:hypothetical protein